MFWLGADPTPEPNRSLLPLGGEYIVNRTMDAAPAVGNIVEDGELVNEQQATKRKMSLSRCGVCQAEEARYRCPACLKHSCSLICVKKHKEETGCCGVRNKTAFIPLSHFDEMALLSDYRLLEDTGRMADSSTRDALLRGRRVTFRAQKLAVEARKINITLRFLPTTFTKSRENSTVYLSKLHMFLWHLKILFPQCDAEYSERRVSSEKTLQHILAAYIHPTESDPVRRQRLKMYVQASLDDIKVFLKAEGRRANSVRYHQLDLGKSLKENLSYKTLIEYPTLHVVLPSHWHQYPVKGQDQSPAITTKAPTESERGPNEVVPSPVPSPPPEPAVPTEPKAFGDTISCPEMEPPKEKKAKRDPEEEIEEGEITDSSSEEEQEVDKEEKMMVEEVIKEEIPALSTAADGSPADFHGNPGHVDMGAYVSACRLPW